METQRPFHRLFGVSLIDLFRGTSITVELEKDLSLKQQLLDVVILRKESPTTTPRLPDGFEELAPHNLITFKSYQEALDAWALLELLGHYVNYRKQVSPSMKNLLPESDFRLFAVCARFPQNPARHEELRMIAPGVYEVRHFGGVIRIIVVRDLPHQEQNARLHLFSAQQELIRYGRAHFRPNSQETSTLLYELFKAYGEAPDMPDQLQEFVRESIDRFLKNLTVEERLKGLSPDERLKSLSPDDLAALSPEVRAALLQQLKNSGSQ